MVMKLIGIIPVVVFISYASASNGECISKEAGSAHNTFCQSLGESNCSSHHVCKWKSDEKTLKVVIEQKQNKCVAKDGAEAHESFCGEHNKQVCKVHSSVCEWK